MNKLTEQEYVRKPDGGLAEQIEVLEAFAAGDADNTELLMLLIELRSLRKQRVALKVDITCYSCRRFITFQEHAEADGFCPYCDVEIELTPPDLAHTDVRTIEDNLIEQVGLMCDRAVNIHEKNVYGEAFCVLKYGILPYLRKKGK